MAKEIRTKAHLQGGKITTKANFGQTVAVTVLPDPYEGQTTVTPSDERQTLPTRGKTVATDITVLPAPTETLSATSNGTFTPSDGHVGFSQVDVNVNVVPDLRPLSVSENGTYEPDDFDGYSDVTVDVEPNLTSLAVTENGLYLPESGVDGFDRVSVDVPSEVTYDEMASGTKPSGDITITVTEIVNMAFRDRTGITGVNAPNCTKIGNQAFMNDGNITFVNLPNVEQIGDNAFAYVKLSSLVLPSIKTIGNNSFGWISTLKDVVIGTTCQSIGEGLLRNTTSGWVCKFLGTPTSLASRTFYNTQGGDIYVPWSQGEVANAPWGASNATIHYDTVYDEEWNVISST